MRTLLMLLIIAALFSCKKENGQMQGGAQPEAYYESFVRQHMTVIPGVSADLLAAAKPGFATFKEVYEYYKTRKIVGMSGTKTVKIDLTKTRTASSSPNARTLGVENVWYQATGVYTGSIISNAIWPHYVYISVNTIPLVSYSYNVDINNVKEYYEIAAHDMNFGSPSYTLNGLGTITPSGTGNIQPTFIQQLIQHNYTVNGVTVAETIDYWLHTSVETQLPTWDMPPPGIQLNYWATAEYL